MTIRSAALSVCLLVLIVTGCGPEEEISGGVGEQGDPDGQFMLEAWADNWFAAYDGETLIAEDSVAITTERSFNGERAYFDGAYPLTLNFVLKDFKENDSGLEYIGARNQQMGDGGFIAQITDTSTGAVVGVTAASWKCLVIHEAPLNKSCEGSGDPLAECERRVEEEPADWKASDFDVSGWGAATVHSASAVDPKGGYDDIDWAGDAELIWGPDLESDNTILCRVIIEAP